MSRSTSISKVETKVNKAIFSYNLISNGDRVLVGISGGKDSYSLLNLLISRKKKLPINFDIEACHVIATDMDYKVDMDFMKSYCDAHEIQLHLPEIAVEYNPNQRKPACFICSWKRRKVLFDLAKSRRCNKLALGHHLDDAVETLLLNMINHSSISSLPASLSMFGGRMHLIRPLILLTNADLQHYSNSIGFPSEIQLCPFFDDTQRESIRKLVDDLSVFNKSARTNIFKSMGNIINEYIVLKS